jgi:hypothetical protein
MDDARLNQILEETMNSLLGTQFMEQISRPQPSNNNPTNIIITDLSNSLPLVEEEPSSSVEDPRLSRKYQMLENLSENWFRNNRDYQDINYQMNKISQHLIQNMTSLIADTDPHINSPTNNLLHQSPFLLEVAGISLPTRRQSNVSLYPNIRQVLAATEIYQYTTNSPELSCPLTLEEFQPGEELCRIRHCRHVFTWKYLQEWFCTNSHCPVCRYDIRSFVPTVPTVPVPLMEEPV